MQIQLSTHSFRIFYGESFGEDLATVINAIGDYEIDFTLNWYEEYAIIALAKVPRETWKDILDEVFQDLYERIGSSEEEE